MTFREGIIQAAKGLVGLFDDRSREAAFGLFPGIYPAAVGMYPVRGSRQTLEGYSKMPWLRAVAHRVGAQFASVEWKLYATGPQNGRARRDVVLQRAGYVERKTLITRKQRAGELRELDAHPFLDVMGSANAYQTGYEMRKISMIHLDLVGETFWIKERDGLGTVVGVYPIPPHWIMGTPTPSHRFYRVSFRAWQGEIPDTEILWFRDPDPANPYGRGSGLAMTLGDELEISEYASKFVRQFFFNNARPDILITPKGENAAMNEAETIRLEQRWTDKLQGFWRAFRPMFMSRAVEVTTFDTGDFRQMQINQLRESERNTIIQTWGLPPEMLGIISNSNRSTIDSAAYLMALVVLVPRLEFFRSVLQERLLPEYDERLILDYVSPVSSDREFILKAAQIAPWSLDVDEWRDLMGLSPKDGGTGKVHMIPFNLVPTTEFSAPVVPPEPARGIVSYGGRKALPGDRLDDEWRAALRRDARTFEEADDLAAAGAVLRALADDPEDLPALSRLAGRLEPQMRRRFLQAVASVNGELNLEELARALETGSVTQVEVAAKLDELQRRFDGMVPDLRQGFLIGAQVGWQALSDAGISMRFDLINPHAVSWVQRVGAARVTEIGEETRLAIRSLVERAFTEGRDPRKTARDIKDVIGLHSRQLNAVESFRLRLEADGTLTDAVVDRRVERYAEAQLRLRAQTIARTELMTASGDGQRTLWGEAREQGLLIPERTRRTWITTPDERLCPLCEDLEDAQAELGGQYPKDGGDGPPRHVDCRCSEGIVILRESE